MLTVKVWNDNQELNLLLQELSTLFWVCTCTWPKHVGSQNFF